MLVPRMVTGCVLHHLVFHGFLTDGNLGAAVNELQTDEENPLFRQQPTPSTRLGKRQTFKLNKITSAEN